MGTALQYYPRAIFAGRRAFGDDLAPARQAYFTFIPAALMLVGAVSWTIGNDTSFVLACVTATLAGLYILWEWLLHKGATRLSTLTGMSLLLGYGGGALNTWMTLPRGSLSISETFGLPEGVLARCMGAVLVSSALLIFAGEIFEKPIFGRDFRLVIDDRTRLFIYAGAAAMLLGYLHHSMGIEGATSAQGHLNIFGSFLDWLYPPLTALSVVAFLTARAGGQKVLSGMVCLSLLLMFAFLGRRASVYTSIEIVFLLELAGYRLRELSLRNFLLLLTLAGVIVACSLTFMLLRIAGSSVRRSQQENVSKRVEVVGRMVQQGGAYRLAASATRSNVQTRTFVVGFLANILDASLTKPTAMGRDALGQFEVAVPRALYPGKDAFFSEEKLVDEQFGFGYGDEANSILTAGATDFGLIGMMVYPILMVALMRLLYDLLSGWFRRTTLIFIALSVIYTAIQTEHTLTGSFDALRSLILFGLVVSAFMALPGIKLRAE